MAVQVSQEVFDGMVNDALDKIPDNFARHLRNVVILVSDFNPDSPTILGLYEGVALPERTFDHTGYLPDTISIYKGALERYCTDEQDLAHQIMVTVFHEVGHYFGMDEAQLHHLGWG
ncbi:metallopeptidase family protein [Corynebacterium alimapuense]|uniref:Metallopeptidase family protein n=1 Tax=Corynebacterium alimapuense TaxID=1576874 RepID=A0A3M8KA26_9CORY|nr:metallopeptidase family protein [Corynebacterium alimapuense]RNE50006.1 hypothetical protein C5L39_01140 [Corynebacterium alimapuense]